MFLTLPLLISCYQETVEDQKTAWDNLVTPLSAGLGQQTPPLSMYKRVKTKTDIDTKLKNFTNKVKDENDEGVEVEMAEMEEELRKFHESELEVLRSGGEPLLTCSTCKYVFTTYRGYQGHKCSLRREEGGQEPHYTILEGKDRDTFLESTRFLSDHRKISLCIATRTACRGVFPLIFPKPGNTTLARLEEVGCVGEEAYYNLGPALKDGALLLPASLVLDLPDEGGELYLPQELLTPRPLLKNNCWRSHLLVVEKEEGWLEVRLETPESEDEGVYDLSGDDDSDNDDDESFGPVEGGAGTASATAAGAQSQGQQPSGGVGAQERAPPTARDRQVRLPCSCLLLL